MKLREHIASLCKVAIVIIAMMALTIIGAPARASRVLSRACALSVA
jgi:hypothetical protein